MYLFFVDVRILFFNDFVDSDYLMFYQIILLRKDQMKYKEVFVLFDFKFNVENYGFIFVVDEIFFGGVLLLLEKIYQ